MLTPLAGSPVAYGGFSDAQRGTLDTSHTVDVCIKKFRVSNPGKIKKALRSHEFLPKPLFTDKP